MTISRPSDWDLLRRYASDGDEDAFRGLVERYSNLVYSACHRRLGDRTLAEDASQAVFLVLSRKAGSLTNRFFRGDAALGYWLLKTVRFVSANMSRAEWRRDSYEQEMIRMKLEEMHSTGGDPGRDERQQDELRGNLDECVNTLSRRYREAVTMHYLMGMSCADVAERIGISEEAVRKRLRRGVDQLRRRLRHKGVTITLPVLGAFLGREATEAAPVHLVQTVMGSIGTKAAGTIALSTLVDQTLQMMFLENVKTAIVFCGAIVLAGGIGVVATREIPNLLRPPAAHAPAVSRMPGPAGPAVRSPPALPVESRTTISQQDMKQVSQSARRQLARVKGEGRKRKVSVEDKLRKSMIPELAFQTARIQDVLLTLYLESVIGDAESDEDEKGVPIFLFLPEKGVVGWVHAFGRAAGTPEPMTGHAPAPSERGARDIISGSPLITFHARFVRLAEALKMVTALSGMKFGIQGTAVTVMSQDAPDDSVRLDDTTSLLGSSLPDPWFRIEDWAGFFSGLGVGWPEGSSVRYDEGSRTLAVTNTLENLCLVSAAISPLREIWTKYQRERTEAKLAQIRIPRAEFREEKIRDVVQALARMSADADSPLDPYPGVTASLRLEFGQTHCCTREEDLPKVTLSATDATLGDLFRRATQASRTKYQIRGDRIEIVPSSEPTSPIMARRYDMDILQRRIRVWAVRRKADTGAGGMTPSEESGIPGVQIVRLYSTEDLLTELDRLKEVEDSPDKKNWIEQIWRDLLCTCGVRWPAGSSVTYLGPERAVEIANTEAFHGVLDAILGGAGQRH